MKNRELELTLLPDMFAVARFDPNADIPDWASTESFISITRTQDELSIVSRERLIPPRVQAQRGFRCLQVMGPLEFSEVGILASLAQPLAEAGVSVFVISTYDTDFLFIPSDKLEVGLSVLSEAGNTICDVSDA